MTATKIWEAIEEIAGCPNGRVHIHPLDDALLHETEGADCICGPAYKLEQNEGKPDGWLIIHYALDGRPE